MMFAEVDFDFRTLDELSARLEISLPKSSSEYHGWVRSDRRTVGPSAGATAFVIYCHCSDLGIHLVEDFSDAHGCAWDLPKEALKCCVQFCGMFLQKSH